jgi:hypothetical protein
MLLEVGKLYNPTRRSWPELVHYDYREAGHELAIFWNAPSRREIQAVSKEPIEFGLLIEPPALFFHSQFSLMGAPISTANSPYQWWLNRPEDRRLPNPEPTEDERILLSIVLIDAETGILKVIRAVSLSPEFSALLHQAIREQAAAPFVGAEAYGAHLQQVYARYPTPESMLARAIIRCRGGD